MAPATSSRKYTLDLSKSINSRGSSKPFEKGEPHANYKKSLHSPNATVQSNGGLKFSKKVKELSPEELHMYNEDKKRRNTMNARKRREKYRDGDTEIRELYEANEKRIQVLERQIQVLSSHLH